MKYPLRFIVSYVQHVTQHFESRTVQKAHLQSYTKRKKWCCAPQLYQLSSESEVSITLCCQLCSTHYITLQNQELFKKHLCNHIQKERNGAVHPSYINYRLKVKYPLCFIVSYVQPVKQQYESRTVRKAPLLSNSHYEKY